MSAEWYYHDGSQEHGPLSSRQLADLAAHGSLRPDHRVKKGSDGKWHLASQVKGLVFASPGQSKPSINVPNASPLPLAAHQGPMARPIAADQDTAVRLSDLGITAVKPATGRRPPGSVVARPEALYLQRLMRPPVRPYFIAGACVLAVIAIAALGVMVGRLSRPVDQNLRPQVAQSDTLRSETTVAGNGNKPLPASPQAQAADLAEVERLRNGGSLVPSQVQAEPYGQVAGPGVSGESGQENADGEHTKKAWEQIEDISIELAPLRDPILVAFWEQVSTSYAKVNVDYVDSELRGLIHDRAANASDMYALLKSQGEAR